MSFRRVRILTNKLTAEIDKFSEPELKKLIGECRRLSTTNCGWMMYGLKEIITQIARAQLRWLKLKRKKLKKS